MEKYVVSRNLAEKLKSAGYPQTETAQYYWYREGGIEMEAKLYSQSEAPFYSADEYSVAPLSDELLEQLPWYILIEDGRTHNYGGENFDLSGHYMLEGEKWEKNDYAYRYLDAGNGVGTLPGSPHHSSKPADALAELWLWCKENGYIA